MSVLIRSATHPAAECPYEGALLRVTEQVGDLRKGVAARGQQAGRQVIADLVEQLAECQGPSFQLTLQCAGEEPQGARDLLEPGWAERQGLDDSRLDPAGERILQPRLLLQQQQVALDDVQQPLVR